MFSGEKGFTILEIVIGVSIFLVGMLGVAAMEISAIRAEAFSIRLTEATLLARSTFEELMSAAYSDARLDATIFDVATCTDIEKFNVTDRVPTSSCPTPATTAQLEPFNKWNIDPGDNTQVEHDLGTQGTNNKFRVFYNLCEDCLIDETKSIRVFVRWTVKDQQQTVDFFGIIPRS